MASSVFITPNIIFAHTLGTALCGISIGIISDITLLGVPALLAGPNPRVSGTSASKTGSEKTRTQHEAVASDQHIAYQWTTIYDLGKKLSPVVGISSAACFAYVYRSIPAVATFQLQRRLMLTAAIMPLCIMPFTVLLMAKMNSEIYSGRSDAVEDRAGKQGWERYSTQELIVRWSKYNMARAIFPMLGIVAAASSLLV